MSSIQFKVDNSNKVNIIFNSPLSHTFEYENASFIFNEGTPNQFIINFNRGIITQIEFVHNNFWIKAHSNPPMNLEVYKTIDSTHFGYKRTSEAMYPIIGMIDKDGDKLYMSIKDNVLSYEDIDRHVIDSNFIYDTDVLDTYEADIRNKLKSYIDASILNSTEKNKYNAIIDELNYHFIVELNKRIGEEVELNELKNKILNIYNTYLRSMDLYQEFRKIILDLSDEGFNELDLSKYNDNEKTVVNDATYLYRSLIASHSDEIKKYTLKLIELTDKLGVIFKLILENKEHKDIILPFDFD